MIHAHGRNFFLNELMALDDGKVVNFNWKLLVNFSVFYPQLFPPHDPLGNILGKNSFRQISLRLDSVVIELRVFQNMMLLKSGKLEHVLDRRMSGGRLRGTTLALHKINQPFYSLIRLQHIS